MTKTNGKEIAKQIENTEKKLNPLREKITETKKNLKEMMIAENVKKIETDNAVYELKECEKKPSLTLKRISKWLSATAEDEGNSHRPPPPCPPEKLLQWLRDYIAADTTKTVRLSILRKRDVKQ